MFGLLYCYRREFLGSHPTAMEKYLFLGLALIPVRLAAFL
jgi:hypothetical protein